MIDLVGQRFGQLTIIARAEKPEHVTNRETYWLCQCDCGKKIVTIRNGLNGERGRKSCGCKSMRGRQVIDITGQRFSRLLVIKRAEYKKEGQICWLCKCDCGAETIVRSRSLRTGKTRSCGCFRREIVEGNITKKDVENQS